MFLHECVTFCVTESVTNCVTFTFCLGFRLESLSVTARWLENIPLRLAVPRAQSSNPCRTNGPPTAELVCYAARYWPVLTTSGLI